MGLFMLLLLGSGLSFLSSTPMPPSPWGRTILFRDTLCYTTFFGGIQVLDVSDLDAVRVAGHAETPGIPMHMALDYPWLYVADDYNGLVVADVSDPVHPRLVGHLPVPDEAFGVGYWGNYVYVGCKSGGLLVADVSDPTQPQEVGRVVLQDEAMGLEVRHPYLYLAARHEYLHEGSIRVFDISAPADPVQVDSFFWDHCALNNLAVHDSVLYACSELHGSIEANLWLFDISDPMDIRPAGSYLHPGRPAVYDVAFGDDDTLAVASMGTRGMAILNVTDPRNVVPVCTLRTAGHQTEGIGVYQGHAFLLKADFSVAMMLVDISDPANPTIRGNISMGDGYSRPATSGQLAFLARGTSGEEVYDLSDLRHPRLVGVCSTRAHAATARGELLYVSSFRPEYPSIEVYSVRDPAHPVLLCDFDTVTVSANMVLRGDYLYCVGSLRWVGGTYVIAVDVSDSTDLRVAGKLLYFRGSSNEVALDETRPFLYSSEYLKLRVFDISNPDSMAEVAQCELPGDGTGITVRGRYAYLSCYTEGLVVVDIQDPRDPWIAGQYTDPFHNWFTDVEVIPAGAVLTNMFRGVYLLDVTDPQNMILMDVHDTPGAAYHVHAVNDSALAVTDISSVRFLTTGAVGVAARGPDPAPDRRGAAVCRRSLWLSGNMGAELLDIAGRQVVELQPGENDVRGVAPGVYFVREDSRIPGVEGSRVRKIVIQR